MNVSRKELSSIKGILKENPYGMTVTEISRAVKMNRHSVAKYLEVLVATGHVEMKAFGQSKVYYLSQRVPLSAMLSFSSDMIAIVDKNMRVQNVNDKFLEFMGLTRKEALNKDIHDVSQLMKVEPPIMPQIMAALNGKEQSLEAFYHRGGEVYYYFIIKFLPTAFEDGEIGAALVMSDITEKRRIENEIKESEEKFRNLAETVAGGIMIVQNKKIAYANKAASRITGYRVEELIGKSMQELIHPDHFGVLKELRLDYARDSDSCPRMPYEIMIVDKRGETRWIELTLGYMRINGRPAIIKAFFDITRRKKAEEALLKERSELEARVK
ncbi:putative PAS sensor signal transduction histidine kinase [Methanocella conradii HZ254]|uniref:PAS sensor signal transduction histidine kinase n=1 Tax=Methanocella conradii (strain DSM 24694 / JCM 17849 / CGMCC 1.5162 / HZ254) TaxID=1041930 RepID=H8I9R6_METCZ|nr:PAS domain S-box protein [Methanocella conradii]AFD00517.1 putative PAS sensor signal transduction histidine kinase [Methanocella conradii HZ254]